MKDFINTLKQTKKVTGDYIYFGVFFSIVAAIIGGIEAQMLLRKYGVWNYTGSFMVLMFMAIVVLVEGFWIFPAEFMRALSMGKARKHLFPVNYLLWLRNTLVVLLIALGINLLEHFVYMRFSAEAVYAVGVGPLLSNPLVFVTILLCVPALILFLGGSTLFFGIKLVWIFLGIFMIGIGVSNFTESHPESPIVKWLDGLLGGVSDVVPICLLCLLGAVILLGLAWLMLRKQRVTF